MAKYIERDAFIEWLKKIPMVDLSDGRGLCRVIMEDDFKRAIKNIPESIIHNSEVEVVRCRECKHLNVLNRKELYAHCPKTNTVFLPFELDTREHFCSLGERKDGDGNG